MGTQSEASAASGTQNENAFPRTHWSIVLDAARLCAPGSEQAFAHLCSAYWFPLYAFIRRRGYSTTEAEDLTQSFFACLLEKQGLKRIEQEGGRFRSYLLTMLKHFLANERARAQTCKRGGGQNIISIDQEALKPEQEFELADRDTPETLYEKHWAAALLAQVMARLEKEYEVTGRARLFSELRFHLSGDKGLIQHAEIGSRCGMSEGAVKAAVHRLRKRYGQLLREEIASLVANPDDIDAEIRYLISVLGE
jgi:RNA polymerase sigma-70 factor (ECF subfamily)